MAWGWILSAAAVVGVVVLTFKIETIWQWLEERTRERWRTRRISREAKRSGVQRIATEVAEVYAKHGNADALYQPTTVDRAERVPLLANNAFHAIRIKFESDELVKIGREGRIDFPVNMRLVKKQLSLGRRLTDDSALFLDRVEEGSSSPLFYAGTTGYRATATLADLVGRTLQGQTGSAIDVADLASFEVAVRSSSLRPMVIATDAVCTFFDGARHVVPIHRRSPRTASAPGAYTVTPAYVYESNAVAGVTSKFGLVGYNFLREFLEEFWCGDEEDELVSSSSKPRANPDWIFESDQGRRLLAEVDSGRVELYSTGVAVDVSHCCLTVALAARFTSPEYLSYVMAAPGGWEGEPAADGRPSVEFLDLFGQDIEVMFRTNMKPTTAFAIDGARRHVAELSSL